MTADHAQSVVLMSGALVFFMGWFYSAKHTGKVLPPASFLIPACVVFLGLEVIADIQPELAAAIAVAVGSTAFFHYGQGILKYINTAGGTNTPTAKASSTPTRTKETVRNAR
jgi:hypothetical protein